MLNTKMKWFEFAKYKPNNIGNEYLIANEQYVLLVYLDKNNRFIFTDTGCCGDDQDVTEEVLYWAEIQNPCQMELF